MVCISTNNPSFQKILIALIDSANEFCCCECKKLLPTERLLREHMRYHRSDFICPHCPVDDDTQKRSFSSAHSLATHINYCHSELRPFTCTEPECNYSAKSQTDLNRHIEVHDNTLWYCCEVFIECNL